MAATPRIKLDDADGVPVISFMDRRLFDDVTVREVGEQMLAALPRGKQPVALILDFSGVDSISSAMLGKLILVLRQVDSAGGKLRLCELSPNVRAVLESTNLDRLFAIDRDCRAAREALEASGTV